MADRAADPAPAVAVHEVLAAAPEPLSASQIRGRLRKRKVPADIDLEALLEGEVAAGRVFRYGIAGDPRYWGGNVDAYAEALVARRLAKKPMTLAALERIVGAELPAYPAASVADLVNHLIAEGRAHRLPAASSGRGAADRFGTVPADPGTYLRALVTAFLEDLDREVARLETYGITRTASYAAALALLSGHPLCGTPESGSPAAAATPELLKAGLSTAGPLTGSALEDYILEGVQRLSRTRHHGGLVAIRELRDAISDRCADKAAFDAALSSLARGNRVWLYRHDFPASLSAEEREGMMADAQGSYYNGVSLRE